MFDLPKYGDGICLARSSALLDRLGIDRARLQRRSIVVTGSNGKGSTAAFAASIGRAFGLRTGLFTSPHLFRFNERFKIDGADIDDVLLSALVPHISTAIDALPRERFGAFEAQFALACLYFQEADCDLMVFEAGIGGRFDPVRLVGTGITCVTSVDYEHVDLLGPSLEAIASDKSDACAAGGSIIYGDNCKELMPHLRAYNRNRNITSILVGDQIRTVDVETGRGWQRFGFAWGASFIPSLEIALPGRFQINNAAIATALFLNWIDGMSFEAGSSAVDEAIRAGLRDARWPGRLDAISHDPFTVIDVGHTPDGVAQSLSGLFETFGRDNWILVLGVSRDKDVASIVSRLAPSFDRIICTSAHHKGADVKMVAAAARHANPSADISAEPSIAEAVRGSRRQAQASGRRICVAGGLFVAIEYAHALRGGDPDRLTFF